MNQPTPDGQSPALPQLPESDTDENLFVLNFATRLLLGINHRDELLRVAIETFADFGHSERLTFYALSEQKQTATLEAAWYRRPLDIGKQTFALSENPPFKALFNKTPQTLHGHIENEILKPGAGSAPCAILAFPVIAEGGKMVGSMLLHLDHPLSFGEWQHLRVLASVFAIAIENLRLIHFTTRSTEARYRAIVDNSIDLICRFVADGSITFVNETFCRFFDQPESRFLQKPFHLETCETDRDSFNEVWASLSPDMASREIRCRVLPTPGSERWMHWVFRPVLDDDGTFIEYQAVGRDITLPMRAEEERRAIESKMVEAQKLESLGILAGGVAHDFNNLLATVLGNIDLSLEMPGVPESVLECLREAKTATITASKLSQQMLTYAGHQIMRPKPVNLNEALQSLQHLWESNLPSNVSLSFSFADDLPDIHADTAQVHQVLLNIISNAEESFDENGGTIKVSTGYTTLTKDDLQPMKCDPGTPAGPFVYVTVADTGCGIAPDMLPQIFEPFYSSKFIGRGLGLAAAYGIVRAHDGAIRLESQPGAGTRFTVYFPLSRAQTPRTQSSAGGQHVGAPKTQYHILVVEDEPAVRKVLEYVLTRASHTVDVAIDGLDGLEQFQANPQIYDAVLMDIKMPRMNGDKAFHEIKKIRPELPIIVLTGYAEESVIASFHPGEPAAFLQKPFEVQHLLSALKHVLG